jgi:hypothetical protein
VEDLGAPSSYLELGEGAECFSRDGERVGKVGEVRAAPDQDIFDGIVIDTGAGQRFVDGADVQEIFERGVVLKLDLAETENLPENPG